MKQNCYFFGATGAGGFTSLFSQMYDPSDGWKIYIIKGGPGTGKSSMMKRVAQAAAEAGDRVELGVCSSDPDSLDVVLLPDRKIGIADGTAPHVMEPVYPGACETILNLGSCWDKDALHAAAADIIDATQTNAAHHQQAGRYLSAAGTLLQDRYRLLLECTDCDKVRRYATGLAKRLFGSAGRERGREQVRFLSAVTPKGHLFLEDTVHAMCKRVIAVEGENTAVSRMILSILRSAALDAGLEVISCPCPIHPADKLEHLLIPSMGLAVCTSNEFHAVCKADRRIHSRRFTDAEAVKERRQKLQFTRRATEDLITGAVEILEKAKASHDQLETFYKNAMRFQAVDAVTNELVEELYPSTEE